MRTSYLLPEVNCSPTGKLAETVLIKITVAPDAKPGPREIRIKTAAGLTNPTIFQVGTIPEYNELEPNNRQAYPTKIPRFPKLPEADPLQLPVLVNGQIMPGDIDRFRFRAKSGQQLVIETQARRLIPYLADAVPGWFQAAITLYDSGGKEVAYADDYRFNPDPVLFYKILRTGEYELEIRDAIYRGREDFVYRIAVSEQPFITNIFPLGGQEGTETVASIEGWNLPKTQLSLDTCAGEEAIRRIACGEEKKISNSVLYAVDSLPECSESESNDTVKNARQVTLPTIINGQISRAEDVDVFPFKGVAGNEIVAEVCARRLNSPLDSLLRLTDDSGKVLVWNDDCVSKDKNHLYKDAEGLLTHHADSYLTAKLPKNGTYYLYLTDSQHHGGPAYGYRLRITAPQPDFALRMTPSSLNIPAGATVPINIYVLRKDGFDGEIQLALKEAPEGFKLDGAKIPAGRDSVCLTLTAPGKIPEGSIALKLEGNAKMGDKTITHTVVPAEDMMQAFLYRHLVPSEELRTVVGKSRWRMPPIELIGSTPVQVPVGGSVQVRLKIPPASGSEGNTTETLPAAHGTDASGCNGHSRRIGISIESG